MSALPPATLGRVVHYTTPVRAVMGVTNLPSIHMAHVAAVDPSGGVSLFILDPDSHDGFYYRHGVKQAATPTPGCWHWPPRA